MTILLTYLVICFCGYHHTKAFMVIQFTLLASKLYIHLLAKNITGETNLNGAHETLMASTRTAGPPMHTLPRCILFFPDTDGESLC